MKWFAHRYAFGSASFGFPGRLHGPLIYTRQAIFLLFFFRTLFVVHDSVLFALLEMKRAPAPTC